MNIASCSANIAELRQSCMLLSHISELGICYNHLANNLQALQKAGSASFRIEVLYLDDCIGENANIFNVH